MKFTPLEFTPYFDLTKWDLNEVSIFQTNDKSSCFISPLNKSHIYKGFKLTDNPRVNIYCEIAFYPSSVTGKYIPRPTFLKLKNDLTEQTTNTPDKVRIDFNDGVDASRYWDLMAFINKFKDLVDVGDFANKFAVVSTENYIVEFKNKSTADKIKDLQNIISSADLSEVEMQAVVRERRQKIIANYHRLLTRPEDHGLYRTKYQINEAGEEAIWHHFLCENHWLLGLNADIKFIRDLIKQTDVGIRTTGGTGSPKVDMLGLSDYTMLIELKTPRTSIFTNTRSNTSRARTWSFSSDFIDGVSQCLAQRTQWERLHMHKQLVKDGVELDQRRYRTLDPKILFLIGCKETEFPETSNEENDLIKRDTFESFRRNNRNVEIMTFDELYQRANYLVTDIR